MQLTACTPSCRDNPPVSNMIDARSHIIFGHQGPPRPPAADTNKRRYCCSSPSLDGAVLCVVTATLWRERVMLGCGCVRGAGVRGRIVTGEKESGRVNTAGCTGSRPLPVRPQEILRRPRNLNVDVWRTSRNVRLRLGSTREHHQGAASEKHKKLLYHWCGSAGTADGPRDRSRRPRFNGVHCRSPSVVTVTESSRSSSQPAACFSLSQQFALQPCLLLLLRHDVLIQLSTCSGRLI